MSPRADVHRWCRARLAAARLDLLDANDRKTFDAHLATCEPCRNAYASFARADDEAAPDAHVPPSLLATWSRSSLALAGIERSLVRAHLARCGLCRGELERLGFAPELALADEPARTHAAGRGFGIVRVVPYAIAFAAVLAVVGTWWSHTPTRSTRAVAEAPVAPAPAIAPPTLDLAPLVSGLMAPTRGTPVPAVVVAIAPGTRMVALPAPPLDVPDSTSVRVWIDGPDGRTVADVTRRGHEFHPRRAIVLGGATPLATGHYVLHMKSLDPAVVDSADYPFDLEPAPR